MQQRRQRTAVEQQLQEEKKTLEAELFSLRAEATHLRSETARLTSEAAAARDEKVAAEHRADTGGEKILELEATLRETYKALQLAEGRVATLLARHDEMETELSVIRRENAQVVLDLQGAHRQVDRLQQQASEAESSLLQSTVLTTRLQNMITT